MKECGTPHRQHRGTRLKVQERLHHPTAGTQEDLLESERGDAVRSEHERVRGGGKRTWCYLALCIFTDKPTS
ncbi:hypothetical protein Q9966_000904 [Columba livia]|nr:hypothetical protein Q9966_000904 [Columba livia]